MFIPGTSFFRPNGFIDRLLTLTSALTGFYVAALVAAATFNHPDLDNVIKSGPIALITRDSEGNNISEFLTRREFICTIFSYLAFAVFLLSVVFALCVGMSSADLSGVQKWPYIGILFKTKIWPYFRGSIVVIISLGIGHLTTATGLEIYDLMDRLYRHDRKITTKKKNSNEAA